VAKFSLDIKASARKELDSLNDALFARIDRKILSLADNPRPAGCKKLRGYKDQWRIRVGDYRVIYLLDDYKALVTIMRVAHRKEVYEA
jgi:mRNA interferase RelE/StbE